MEVCFQNSNKLLLSPLTTTLTSTQRARADTFMLCM